MQVSYRWLQPHIDILNAINLLYKNRLRNALGSEVPTNNDSSTITVETPHIYTQLSVLHIQNVSDWIRGWQARLSLYFRFSVFPIKFWYCTLNMKSFYILTDLYRITSPLSYLLTWHSVIKYCHVFPWLETEFGLVIGFINHLQVVTITKYNTVTDFHITNHSTLIYSVYFQ
jgi:hypothetical protein